MTSLVLTPLTGGSAIELAGGLWRKKLLPVGDVAYKGRTLHFTRPYLEDLARAFAANAYDQVPFQLADSQNTHTNDPERFAGHIIDASAEADGLWVTLKATDRGNVILQENPSLGVSARIVEDYSRSDGQHFPAAIQHVLGTLDPRIPGLGGWQAVEMAYGVPGGSPVIDLSGDSWVSELVFTSPASAGLSLADVGLDGLGASPEEIDQLLDALLEVRAETEAGIPLPSLPGPRGDDDYGPWDDGAQLAQLADLNLLSRTLDFANATEEARITEDVAAGLM